MKDLLQLRKEKADQIAKLTVDDAFLTELIYNDLSFERQFVSQEEVAKVIAGEEIADKEKAQIIMNQFLAFQKIWNLVHDGEAMTEETLKDVHAIIMDGLDKGGGLYRSVDIAIKGSHHTPPSHIKVRKKMKDYIFDTLAEPAEADLVEFIAYAHLQLAKIHPFLDGNGRLSRLVLEYHLLRFGFLPIIIDKNKREDYFKLLEAFKVEKDIEPFKQFLIEKETAALAAL